MRIVCIGGGPAGLYFALLMKKADPGHSVTVVERNRPYDTFGWGVVFSDATMENMRVWDPETAAEIEAAFNHWDDIEVRIKGRVMRTTGHASSASGARSCSTFFRRAARRWVSSSSSSGRWRASWNFPTPIWWSPRRHQFAHPYGESEAFAPDMLIRPNRYVWLGTDKAFEAFTFDFQKTEHGWFQAHIYKFDENTSTFIVETTEETFQKHGLGDLSQPDAIAFCERVFADVLGGHRLMTNAPHLKGTPWLNFQRLICGTWSRFNGQSHVVLMAISAHTAHFAIGSGTSWRSKTRSRCGGSSTRRVTRGRPSRRCWRPTRRCAGSMSRASKTRRATPWNGSRSWASAMPIRCSLSSSCIPC